MMFKQMQGRKRNPSAHQKQMRFFTILFIGGTLLLFAVGFYFVNRWLSHGVL
jgi:hypothetical protein